MRHLTRALAVFASVIIAAVPLALADPAVSHDVSTHPFLAAYVPLVSGLVYALWRAWQEQRPRSTSTSSR